MPLTLRVADYTNPTDGAALVLLLNEYASSKIGGGVPLSEQVQQRLALTLAAMPHAFSILCLANDTPVGLANCFITLSTFKCQPLVNIHDVVITESYRGQGVSQLLLGEVEQQARQKGCCSITLEVLTANGTAQAAYRKYGFTPYQLDADCGSAHFWHKPLA